MANHIRERAIRSARPSPATRANDAPAPPADVMRADREARGSLDEIVKFRLPREMLLDFKRILAYSRGRGYETTLSDLFRDAAGNYRDGVFEALPDIGRIKLPHEDELPERA
jgi:hypothetical protein